MTVRCGVRRSVEPRREAEGAGSASYSTVPLQPYSRPPAPFTDFYTCSPGGCVGRVALAVGKPAAARNTNDSIIL